MEPVSRDPFGWVAAELPPPTYTPTWITHSSYVIPMRDGAVLCWIYDDDGTNVYCLLVRLTEDEAQRVFEADASTGMLEAVRRNLQWRGGLINVKDPDGYTVRSWRYVIQGDTTEAEFVADMMSPPDDVFWDARRLTPLDEQFVASALVSSSLSD